MKICENVYQIKIDFNVKPEIKRYVYVYLITGKDCYLIDAGVAGCEKIIGSYMEKLGRSLSEIKAIFLTHAHPDHIGGAAEIKRISGCEIYASDIEREWIEDIDVQFKERPIPNFYSLVNESVNVERVVNDNDEIVLEDGITIQVLDTAGHSKGEVSYIYKEQDVIFCGDTIPVADDFPIFVDALKSELSINKICGLKNICICCPAWDEVYFEKDIFEAIQKGSNVINNLKRCVKQIQKEKKSLTESEIGNIGISLGLGNVSGNPLFRKSIEACLKI